MGESTQSTGTSREVKKCIILYEIWLNYNVMKNCNDKEIVWLKNSMIEKYYDWNSWDVQIITVKEDESWWEYYLM